MEKQSAIDTGYDKRVGFWENLSICSLPREIWADIPFFDGLYQISSFGRVKSLSKKWQPSIKVLKYRLTKSGYATVCLMKGKVRHYRLVSRLVADAFIVNSDNLPEVNHLNGRKYDNCVLNLERSTHKDNTDHAFRTGLNNHYGEKHTYSALKNKDAIFIANSSISNDGLAKRFKVNINTIWSVKSGKTYSRITGIKYEPSDRLREDEVLAICSSKDKNEELAKKYGIGKSTVSQIKIGLIYSKLTGIIYTKGKKRSSNYYSKPVIQYDKEMNEINRFKSLREASNVTRYSYSRLSSHLNGKWPSYKGYIFKYNTNGTAR